MNSFTHFAWGAFILLLFIQPRRNRVLWLILGGALGMLPDIDLSFAINGLAEHGCSVETCNMVVGNLASPTHNLFFTTLVAILIGHVTILIGHIVGVKSKDIYLLATKVIVATFIIFYSHWAILDYLTPAIRGLLLPLFNGYADGCNRLTSTVVGWVAWSGIGVMEVLKMKERGGE